MLTDIEFDGIDWSDSPDFCDAYISSAKWADTGKELSIDEIEAISGADVYQYLMEYLY